MAGRKNQVIEAAKKVGETRLGNRVLDISKASKDAVKDMLDFIAKDPNRQNYVGPLQKALEADSTTRRNAIMWGLSQQPAFRKLYENYLKEEE